jgi:chemotaxis protein methyltransferase CheR
MVNDLEYDAFLKEACPPLDLAWRKYRRRAARRRVRDRMRELGLVDYRAYLDILRKNGEETSDERQPFFPVTTIIFPVF